AVRNSAVSRSTSETSDRAVENWRISWSASASADVSAPSSCASCTLPGPPLTPAFENATADEAGAVFGRCLRRNAIGVPLLDKAMIWNRGSEKPRHPAIWEQP